MLGAIIGDIIGSVYEFGSEKTKDFPLFVGDCHPTDDSVLTIAVGLTCTSADCEDEYEFKSTLVQTMREIGRQYCDAGFGEDFYHWMMSESKKPYGSIANGSAMRVSPVAWVAETLEDAERLAKWSAEITHNTPEGIRGAQAVAAAIFMARTGYDRDEIRSYIEGKYYNLNFTVDEIRAAYQYSITCEDSVPQAIVCFLDAEDYEDAVRNAVSLGGDGDTQACIAGAIAEAYFGIPEEIKDEALSYLDDTLAEYFWEYADALYGG